MQAQYEKSGTFAGQLPKNLIMNIAYFLINLMIGILLVPYFLSTLGVAAYGLIPLATSITGYVALVVQSLNTSVSRHLTVDLQQENYLAANRTFNTAIFGLSAVLLLMVPVVLVVSYAIPTFFAVPAGLENEVMLLFLGVCAAFLVRSWSGNFTVQLFAYNRLDLQNVVNITNILVQTGLIVLLFRLYTPSLALVGLAYLAGAIAASVVAVVLAKKVCPYLKISIGSFDRSRLRVLCNMGWWVIVNQIGSLLFLQIDLVVVNLLFGAASAGEYSIVLTWVVLLRGFAEVISGVLTPMAFTYYAREQSEMLVKMTISAVKFMGLCIALPVGLICGLAPQILTVWIGEKYAVLATLMVMMVFHLTVNLTVLPLFSVNIAYNKIKVPGLVTLMMGGANLALAIVISLGAGWGIYGVAVAGAMVLTLKNAIFTPWYATKFLDISMRSIARAMVPGIGMTVALVTVSILTGFIVPVHSMEALIVVGGGLSLSYLAIVWRLCLSTSERKLLAAYLPIGSKRPAI